MHYPVIYIITNKADGKRYVGQSVRFDKRLRGHMKPPKKGNNSLIGRALRKYGLEAFDVQRIAYAREELSYWEKYFVGKLNTMYPNGYNLTAGGEDGIKSEITKKRISDSLMGHSVSDAVREAVRQAKLGVPLTPEHIQHITENAAHRVVPEEEKRALSEARLGVPRLEEHKAKMRHPKCEQGRANIAESNRLRRENGELPPMTGKTHREDSIQKMRETALANAAAGIGNVNYFREHKFVGEDHANWIPREKRHCKTCGEEFEVTPNRRKKYCSVQCSATDPDKSQKDKILTPENLANIKIAQRKRREQEGNRRHIVCANPACGKEMNAPPKSKRKYCCRDCYLAGKTVREYQFLRRKPELNAVRAAA